MRFKFSLLPTVLAVAGMVITLLLGNWQSGRAREKEALQAAIDQATIEAPVRLVPDSAFTDSLYHHRIEVRGRFIAAHTIFLDNRLRSSVPGYEVVTPFALAQGKAVLVNRGWIAAGPDRSRLPAIPTDESETSILGLAIPPTTRYMELSEATVAGNLWQNLDTRRYAQRTGLALLPVVIQLHSELNDGLQRQWPRSDGRSDTHRAYAMQWYTMSAAIFLVYLILNVRRR